MYHDSLPDRLFTFMERKESFLNGGLYRNTCQKLNIFVKNAARNSLHGNVKNEYAVLKYVVLNKYTEFLLRNARQVKTLIVNIVERSFMFQGGEQKLIKESIVQKNVIGKINQEHHLAKETLNISMGELKNTQRRFTFQLNGEDCENGFMNETIMNVRYAENMADNCMPIILFQSENAKTHSENQISSRCVEDVTNNSIVLNNRQEVKT